MNRLELPPLPKDGWQGFRENLRVDATSGFVVFLLALPLSLGIATASEFPPVMGLVTAIIGGLVATFFTGSQLTIKGPAAGLIVIVADTVGAFGGGPQGWHFALGVMVVAGLIQILMGVLKWGRFVDLFPLSAVHGMLAAIGLIIIAKQIPVLLNVDPAMAAGKGPIALLAAIPTFVANLDPRVSLIGGISLAIMAGWPLVKHPFLKQIPAPLFILLFCIPAGMVMNLAESAPGHTLVKVGNLTEQIGLNASTGGFSHPGIFIKFVIMLALVGTLESLLTVKAIDTLDPWKRKSDPNKDVVAIGVSNSLAGLLGGLPMISEVARSSANVAQGARTRWANFFHGLFLLLAVLLAYEVLELIPNAALAAMLIAVGCKLAPLRKFIQTFQIGPDQLAIFLITIFFTLFQDLLVGIVAGIILKLFINLSRVPSLKAHFHGTMKLRRDEDQFFLAFGPAAVFTNFLGIKKHLERIPGGKSLTLDFTKTRTIDHSVFANLHQFKEEYTRKGGTIIEVGMEGLAPISAHPFAARKRSRS